MVFSSYYLNNPASAFGHTFLRLNREEVASGGERLDLIDQAVDFAAILGRKVPTRRADVVVDLLG